jgi:hypothetical protein
VQRLNEYKSKLIVFPLRRTKNPKKGDSSPEETKTVSARGGAGTDGVAYGGFA